MDAASEEEDAWGWDWGREGWEFVLSFWREGKTEDVDGRAGVSLEGAAGRTESVRRDLERERKGVMGMAGGGRKGGREEEEEDKREEEESDRGNMSLRAGPEHLSRECALGSGSGHWRHPMAPAHPH